jgi:cellulose synthase/poly-beta-1,6-N-acetylglucosamine synthase-like glycosyltransferase
MFQQKVLIGICAYNEESNIRLLLQNLISEQGLPENYRILVVCSGCTDKTPAVVEEYEKKDARIRKIVEKSRLGKANALNKLFRAAKESADILVLVNADALPERGSITKLASKLAIDNTGAVFAQPVPSKTFRGICYGIVNVIWRLHHMISLHQRPKLSGELCAIRTSCLQEIPEKIATDEPFIELSILNQGYSVLYAPEARVYIRCPTNTSDLLKQRTRIWLGHMQLQNSTNFAVSTSSFRNIVRASFVLKPNEILYVFLGALIEAIAYFQAKIALNKKAIPYAWEPIRSTKIQL